MHLPLRTGFLVGKDFPPKVGANCERPNASTLIVLKDRL
jgi:hypothetical protein